MTAFETFILTICLVIVTAFLSGVCMWKKLEKTYEDILISNCQRLIDDDIVSEASQARLTKDFKCYLKVVNFWGSTWREATQEELNFLPY